MLNVKSIDDYKSSKIISLDEARAKIANIKKKNQRAGLCHGGFDLTHPGHVKHFEMAKKFSDVLFVSVTSDRYVSERKGNGRPIYNDKLRAYMIASIEYVDYVVITDFKSGIDVIKMLQPSYYIKGPDFINKTTPGITSERVAIKEVGGDMKYTTEPPMSTTSIIEYIKNAVDRKKLLIIIDRDGTIILNNDFFGKQPDWKDKIQYNEEVISFIYYLQTKYDTLKIVVSNQAGVARKLFTCKTVEDINKAIEKELNKKGIRIESWHYCPYVDSKYAAAHPEMVFDKKFVQEHTKRKPCTEMVTDALIQLNKDIREFSEIIVIGDRQEDKELADGLKGAYIDVNNKNCSCLSAEFDKLSK